MQEAELKLQKLGNKLTQGEVLIKEIAEGGVSEGAGDSISAREAKILKKKAKEAIRAASEQEMQDKSEELSKAKREAAALAKDAALWMREAKKDKTKMELALEKKAQADAAYILYKDQKAASASRKKELNHLARHVNVDQAAAVIDLGDKPRKKGSRKLSLFVYFLLCFVLFGFVLFGFVLFLRLFFLLFRHSFCFKNSTTNECVGGRVRRACILSFMGNASGGIWYEMIFFMSHSSFILTVLFCLAVRRSLAGQVSCVETDQVTCGGPGGKYGNKGGCAVSLLVFYQCVCVCFCFLFQKKKKKKCWAHFLLLCRCSFGSTPRKGSKI